MIERIHIKELASFGASVQSMTGLKQFNYAYGANATGKTTISKVIAEPALHPQCKLDWKGGLQMETAVYNRDFVAANFNPSSDIKGVFTLGKKDKDLLDKIEKAKDELDKINGSLKTLKATLHGEDELGGKRAEKAGVDTGFEEDCWKQKVKHEAKLQDAFKKVLFKKLFVGRMLAEHTKNKATLRTLEEIERSAETVFGVTPTAENLIAKPDFKALLETETAAILKKKIIGKKDIDIAAMIDRLGNSDWVKQGIPLYRINDQVCPFCQQVTKAELAKSLADYFDETFESDSNDVKGVYDTYVTERTRVIQEIQAIITAQPRSLDIEKLRSELKLFEARATTNVQNLEKKSNELSQAVVLKGLANVAQTIEDLLDGANKVIGEHNRMVANLGPERQKLTDEVWRYLLDNEVATTIKTYSGKVDALNKAITALEGQIKASEEVKSKKEAEIRSLEKQTTTIQPTIDAINSLLQSFGFISFKLARSEQESYYKIVREDGSDAKETLSEGERTFITFLYFYHYLQGSATDSGMTKDRVVVFDDPVSSLDSDVLFIVSSLIRRLVGEVEKGAGHIKQVFILTHNVYFHKEVTFDKRRTSGVLNTETFWVVRKLNGASSLVRQTENPIKTSYELLWSEVKNPVRSRLTIQNTLRRILENYFKVLGGIDTKDIVELFKAEDKMYCGALVSWIHDGSHFMDDELYRAITDEEVVKYLDVFKQIFSRMKHEAHYKMMMGEVA